MISDATLRRLLRSDALVALVGDLVRSLLAVAMATVVVWFAVYYGTLARVMFVTLHMNDFGKFYYSTRAFLNGGSLYAPNPATAIPVSDAVTWQLGNMNPPHFHLLMLPLAILSEAPALLVWVMASALALIGSLRMAARAAGVQWTPRGVLWTTVGIIACAPTGTILVTGQLAFLLMLPVTLAWVAARRGQWSRAAVLLGVAASVKPFLGLFGLYLLVTRRVRAATAMAIAAAAAMGAGLAVFGWRAYVDWIHVLSEVNWTWAPMNGSAVGIVARLFTTNVFFVPLIAAPQLVAPIATAVAVSIAGITLAAATVDDSPESVDRTFVMVLLASLLASPLGWVYYLWIVAGPAVALARSLTLRVSRWRDAFLLLAGPGLMCPVYVTLTWQHEPWGGVTLGSAYSWSVLALWTAVLFDWRARSGAISPARNTPRRW